MVLVAILVVLGLGYLFREAIFWKKYVNEEGFSLMMPASWYAIDDGKRDDGSVWFYIYPKKDLVQDGLDPVDPLGTVTVSTVKQVVKQGSNTSTISLGKYQGFYTVNDSFNKDIYSDRINPCRLTFLGSLCTRGDFGRTFRSCCCRYF